MTQDDVSSDEGGSDGGGAAPMEGMRVKHSANELGAGETVILTLADCNILDEAGGLNEEDAPEELEDVQSVCAHHSLHCTIWLNLPNMTLVVPYCLSLAN